MEPVIPGPGGWAVAAVVLAGVAGWFVLPAPGRVRTPSLGRRLLMTLAVVLVLVLAPLHWWGALAVCAVLLPAALLMRRQRRRRAERAGVGDQVLEACDLVAAELGAGSPPHRALDRAAEVCPLLVPVGDAGRLGADVSQALRRAAEAPGAGDLRLLAAAWHVAHRSGQGLAAATGRIAQRLRAQRRTARVVESELSSARATARLVAALPVAAWVTGAGTGARPLDFLTGSPVGLVCLAAGLGLTVAGLWWIEALADEAAR